MRSKELFKRQDSSRDIEEQFEFVEENALNEEEELEYEYETKTDKIDKIETDLWSLVEEYSNNKFDVELVKAVLASGMVRRQKKL